MLRLLVHLRPHFQLLLAPVFLWGWLVAGGVALNTSIGLAFISLHVFLYGGATAFNSYYDRDVGPVGGLEHPPPVTPALLPFALAVKALGLILAWFVNVSFAVVYALFALLSMAYSHPRMRLKARPLSSVLTVGFGQGALAFAAAWAATRGELRSMLSLDGVLGATAATILILALYPLTQLYQIDEDAARGDRTLAVDWGVRRCFEFSCACTAVGGAAMLIVIARRFTILDVMLVGVGLVLQVAAIAAWARTYEPTQVLTNYRHVMRLNTASAGALATYLLVRLVHA